MRVSPMIDSAAAELVVHLRQALRIPRNYRRVRTRHGPTGRDGSVAAKAVLQWLHHLAQTMVDTLQATIDDPDTPVLVIGASCLVCGEPFEAIKVRRWLGIISCRPCGCWIMLLNKGRQPD